MSMTKETKIGLAVIIVLGIVFCAVLVRRFIGGSDTPAVASSSEVNQTNKADSHSAEKPIQQPTIVHDHTGTAKAPTTTVPPAKAQENDEYRKSNSNYDDYQGSSRRTAQAVLLPVENGNTNTAQQNSNTAVPSGRYDNPQVQTPNALTPNPQIAQDVNQKPSYANQEDTPRELNITVGPAESNQSTADQQYQPNHKRQDWQSNQAKGGNLNQQNQSNPNQGNLVATPAAAQVPVDSFRRRGVAELDNRNQSQVQNTKQYQPSTNQNVEQKQPYRPNTQTHQVGDGRLDSKRQNDDDLEGNYAKSNSSSRPNNGLYVVQPNDNFWKISRSVYGTGGFYKALVQHNRLKYPRPSLIKVGDEVEVPRMAELRKKYPDFCPKDRSKGIGSKVKMVSHKKYFGPTRIYVVEEGDTLSDIAKYELGKVSKWDIIYRLNREQLGNDFNHLKPGTRLIIPDSRNNSRQSPQQEQPSGRVAKDIEYE